MNRMINVFLLRISHAGVGARKNAVPAPAPGILKRRLSSILP